jgi:hypothetical protein
MRTLETEFPEYGPLDFEVPHGFTGSHWHNDASPSWLSPEYANGKTYKLWANYKAPEMREFDGPRFTVTVEDEALSFATVCESEDFATIAAFFNSLQVA